MTEAERRALAARLMREQAVRFGGVARAAYTAARVNSATWARATNGETIKPHIQHKIVASLWPATHGDWTQIPDEETGPSKGGELLDLLDRRLANIESRLSRVELQLRPPLRGVSKKGDVEEPGEFT